MKVVPIGGSSTVTPVRLGDPDGRPVPIVTGIQRPTELDDVADVNGTASAPIGSVLTKTDSGWTGRPPEITDWWSGEGPPPPVIPGASPGDLYFDTVGKGLYRLV
jgi:hypothetical protein